MAIHAHTIPTTPLPPFARWRDYLAALTRAFARHRDAQLLAACRDFNRFNAVLAATPPDDEHATSAAWEARQRVADRLAAIRPASDAGPCAKAAVGVAVMLEMASWERGPEWEFALAAFRAEVGA